MDTCEASNLIFSTVRIYFTVMRVLTKSKPGKGYQLADMELPIPVGDEL